MRKNGFYGVGCYNMKNALNYGTLFRTAQILNADFIFLIGQRFKKQSSDTMKSYRHIPLFEYRDFDEFTKHRPYGCKLIGIEITNKAKKLKDFKHPKQACYLLGAEDHGLPPKVIDNCDSVVYLEGERSMNVSVAGSIVLYDRISKN